MSTKSGTFVLLAWVCSLSAAHAHPVTVDGLIGDWESRTAFVANQGVVARNAMGEGELIWTDATGDALPAFMTPERAADIAEIVEEARR